MINFINHLICKNLYFIIMSLWFNLVISKMFSLNPQNFCTNLNEESMPSSDHWTSLSGGLSAKINLTESAPYLSIMFWGSIVFLLILTLTQMVLRLLFWLVFLMKIIFFRFLKIPLQVQPIVIFIFISFVTNHPLSE